MGTILGGIAGYVVVFLHNRLQLPNEGMYKGPVPLGSILFGSKITLELWKDLLRCNLEASNLCQGIIWQRSSYGQSFDLCLARIRVHAVHIKGLKALDIDESP